jgi:hypothetical protein
MAVFYVPIFKQTVTSPGSITFNNIPQVFDDLELVVNGQTAYTIGGADGYMWFQDGFSTTNYSSTTLQGNGSGISGYRYTNNGTMSVFNMLGNSSTSTQTSFKILIPNYRSSVWKSVMSQSVSENNGSVGLDSLMAGQWRNTAAVTAIGLTIADGFKIGTEFSLYGIYR